MMTETIQKGDAVRFYFSSGKAIEGTVEYIPTEPMDWWIVEEKGVIAYVQNFEYVVLQKKAGENDA